MDRGIRGPQDMSLADFVDYTNVTESEKFGFKLSNLMKEISNEETEDREALNCDGEYQREVKFREVNFRLRKVKSKDDPILQGIPHFRFTGGIQKSFDLSEFWLLECLDKSRLVSDATGRLLLGCLIQASAAGEVVFVRLGEIESSEKVLGFRKGTKGRPSEYFETFSSETTGSEADSFEKEGKSAQLILEWFPGDLRINFPGFSGYFDAWHPIQRIQVTCVWPQIPREGLKFERQDLESAPIMLVEYEESDQSVSLRNSTLRSIQAAHLREVLFTEMGDTKLLSILVARDLKLPPISGSIESVYDAMAQVYRRETEKLEKDLTVRFNFIPKRVMETMRWERLNEAFSLIWRRFINSLEEAWNVLGAVDLTGISQSGEIENSLKLINWCIEREIEWQGQLSDHVLLRKLYKIPPRRQYTADKLSITEKIAEMEGKLTGGLEELNELKRQLAGEGDADGGIEDDFVDCAESDCSDSSNEYERKVLGHINDHVVYEPVVLNCEPPPTKLLTKSLLNNPLAGEVIALNQLKEDIRVFKAWNKEICRVKSFIKKCDGECGGDDWQDEEVCVDLGFIGFLLWHSPNDVEFRKEQIFISQRMRDDSGQWLNLWRDGQQSENLSLNQQVSFNHRALLGQVLSDLTLQTDLKRLLESSTPFLTERATELLGFEAESILKSVMKADVSEKYPLDVINAKLDAHEKEITKRLALEALCSDIFPGGEPRVLVSTEVQRQYLMNKQHEFKIKRKEIVRNDGGVQFREIVGGFEGIRVALSY